MIAIKYLYGEKMEWETKGLPYGNPLNNIVFK